MLLDEKESFFFHNKAASKQMHRRYHAYNKTVLAIKLARHASQAKRNKDEHAARRLAKLVARAERIMRVSVCDVDEYEIDPDWIDEE